MPDDPFQALSKYGKRKKQFFLHMGLASFSSVIMFVFNLISQPDNLWTPKISFVWMIIIVVHYVYAFGILDSNKPQNVHHSEEADAIDKLHLKEKEKRYRDSDLV